jgi:hypothetical protein
MDPLVGELEDLIQIEGITNAKTVAPEIGSETVDPSSDLVLLPVSLRFILASEQKDSSLRKPPISPNSNVLSSYYPAETYMGEIN